MSEPMCLSGSMSNPGCKSDLLKQEIRELQQRLDSYICRAEQDLEPKLKESRAQVEKLTKAMEKARKALLKFNWDELSEWRRRGGYVNDHTMENNLAWGRQALLAIEKVKIAALETAAMDRDAKIEEIATDHLQHGEHCAACKDLCKRIRLLEAALSADRK